MAYLKIYIAWSEMCDTGSPEFLWISVVCCIISEVSSCLVTRMHTAPDQKSVLCEQQTRVWEKKLNTASRRVQSSWSV